MDERLKAVREKLIECYGMDIEEAKYFFSTSNYAFIFNEKPYMIRVSLGDSKTRQEVLSEYMWIDDLKMFADTVCAPQPSLNNVPVEEFCINNVHYKSAMFKCAKGKNKKVTEIEPIDIINIGEFLGRIHAASMNSAKAGFVYKRISWRDEISDIWEKAKQKVPSNIMERTEAVVKKIKEIPEDPSYYGMIHGDFHAANFFLDGNNVWAFDFDDCKYGFFLYDIAALCHSWMMFGYHFGKGKTSREVLEQDILPYFKIGYELHIKLPQEHWDLFDLFLEYRFCIAAVALCVIDEIGILSDLEATRQFVCFPLSQPDVLEGCDIILKESAGLLFNF